MLDVFLRPCRTLFIVTWIVSLAVAKPTGASPNAIVARASNESPEASGIQAKSVLRSAHIKHYLTDGVVASSPPNIAWQLSGGETIEFFAYQSIHDPPSANFYTALISATMQVGQDCANFMLPMLATCLKQHIQEKTMDFDDYSVWLSIENPNLKLTFGTLLLSLEAIGKFFLQTGKLRTQFHVYYNDRVSGSLASGWIEKSLANSGGNGTLPSLQGAVGNLTDGNGSVVASAVDTA